MIPLPSAVRRPLARLLLAFAVVMIGSGQFLHAVEQRVLRVGYFPNVTHAQGVIGAFSTRSGKGWFEQRIGEGVIIQWYPFNAGPSAMEAVFANTIDLTYVGPNPALNAYIRSHGDEIRILAGATEGGAALVVQGDGRITKAADFRDRVLATPQFGNTQDVAARSWLKKNGFKINQTGGEVKVVPTANPDQLSLFQQKRLDAVWTVEPWVSRLEIEGGAKVLIEQKDAVITILVARAKALAEKGDLIAAFVKAHSELNAWLTAHPREAQERLRDALSAEVRRPISLALVESSWKRLHFTDQVSREQFDILVKDAQDVGFLRDAIPLDRLFSRKQ
jgi:NitT/TauT family transport system substrate-binding protein